MHDTAVRARIKQWWHLGGHGVTDLHFHHPDTYSPVVQCFDEVVYERRTVDILRHLRATPFPE